MGAYMSACPSLRVCVCVSLSLLTCVCIGYACQCSPVLKFGARVLVWFIPNWTLSSSWFPFNRPNHRVVSRCSGCMLPLSVLQAHDFWLRYALAVAARGGPQAVLGLDVGRSKTGVALLQPAAGLCAELGILRVPTVAKGSSSALS